ncbi:MAG: histidine kinase [Anaerolineales bacterium]
MSEITKVASWIRSNLRVKFALGLGLPLFFILTSLAVGNYLRERRLAEQQLEDSAQRIGDFTLASLRHGMLQNEPELLQEVMEDLVDLQDIERVKLVDMGGETALATQSQPDLEPASDIDYTCTLCHQHPAAARPRSMRIGESDGLIRIASPIPNDPDCHICHGPEPSHLGMLLIDVSFADLDARLHQDLGSNLALSGGGALLAITVAYLLSHLLVVRRVESFSEPVAKITSGDLTAHVPGEDQSTDELGALARAFNQMADHLNREKRAADARSQVRQRAIIEERNRLARELHDGLSQLLGYLNAKAIAARLKVQSGDGEGAADLLRQLEAASKELFTDVRAAILALKSSGGAGLVFPENLRTYIQRFEELSGLEVDVEFSLQPLAHQVSAETELQLLRITQEALANIYKHAEVDHAVVSLTVVDHTLVLLIQDEGIGFEPGASGTKGADGYGMSTMGERASAIGADLKIESSPGGGTRILVRTPLEER